MGNFILIILDLKFRPIRVRMPPENPVFMEPRKSQARPRPGVVWALRAPPDLASPPIYSLRVENPKIYSLDPRKVSERRHHRRRDLGDRSLYFGTLSGRGIAPGAISIDSTAIFIAVAVSHDEEGVVLPRG